MPPTIPTGLSASSANNKITLKWNANPEVNLVKYNVYKNGAFLVSVNAPTVNYVVEGLNNGIPYTFTITAVDDTNAESAQSAGVTITPGMPETNPFGGSPGPIGNKLDDVGRWDGVTASRTLPEPYENALQQQFPWGSHSFFHVPWRSYMDTQPASVFMEALGTQHNGYVEHMPAVLKMLANHGIKYLRFEPAWYGMEYDDDTVWKEYKRIQFDDLINHCKINGIRPTVLLNANDGFPGPFKNFTIQLTQSAAAGDRDIYVNDMSNFVLHKSGFDASYFGKGAYPFAIAVDSATNKVTLSAPLPGALTSGVNITMITLKYAPLGSDRPGTPEPHRTNSTESIAGFVKFANLIGERIKDALGTLNDAGFDFEVWNEWTFGSSWLDLNRYYNPPVPLASPNFISPLNGISISYGEILYPKIVEHVRNNATKFPGVKVISGFSNQRPFENGTEMDKKEWGFSRHYYSGYESKFYYLATNPENNELYNSSWVNALGDPDGTPDPQEPWNMLPDTVFVPNHILAMPERWALGHQTECVIRDIQPFPSSMLPIHHRFATPGDGIIPEYWMTEVNLYRLNIINEIIAQAGVSYESARALDERLTAKTILRYLAFLPHKGIKRLHIYATTDLNRGFGMISEDCISALTANSWVWTQQIEDMAGPTLKAIKRIYDIAKTGVKIDNPRKLKLDQLVEHNPRWVFRGDGTPEHPDRYHGDEFAFLPFQLTNNKFMIPYYVVTRDIRHSWDITKDVLDPIRYDLPDQDFDVTISNIRGTGATVTVLDPISGNTVPVPIVNSSDTSITVKLKTTDYPRVLTITESVSAPLLLNPKVERTDTGGLLTFTSNHDGVAEVEWGKYPVRKATGTFTEKRWTNQNWIDEPTEIKTISFLDDTPMYTGAGSWEWTGTIKPLYSEEYRFSLDADSQATLYIDGVKVFAPEMNKINTTRISLTAEQTYNLRLTFSTSYTVTARTISFKWMSKSQIPCPVTPDTSIENKMTVNVTAGQVQKIAIDGVGVGDAVKTTLTSATSQLKISYPVWDYDTTKGVIHAGTPFEEDNIGEGTWRKMSFDNVFPNLIRRPVSGSGASINDTSQSISSVYSSSKVEELLEGKSSSGHTHAELHAHPNKSALDRLGVNGSSNLTIDGVEKLGGGSSGGALTHNKPFSYVMNDSPVPVISEGIPFGVGQVLDNTTAGNMFGSPHMPMSYLNEIDVQSLTTYNKAEHTALGIVGFYVAGSGVWTMPDKGIENVKKFGYPGVSVITGKVNPGTNPNGIKRFSQRWYAVPGVENCLYCEIEISNDSTNTGTTRNWSIDSSGATGTEPNIVWAAYAKYNLADYGLQGTNVLAQYDADLDGVSFRGKDAYEDAAWYFIRPVNHKTTGHYFTSVTTPDASMHYATGALPTGVDSINLSNLASPYDYQVYISSKLGGNFRQKNIFRFVIGRGFTELDAKNATKDAPNTSSEAVIEHWKAKLSQLPVPSGLTTDEETAWKYYMYTLMFNSRSNTSYQPEQQANDGINRRILYASLGRWQGSWSGDTAQGINAMAAIDPQLVRDNLDYYLNVCMDKVTGFVRGDPNAWGTGSGAGRTGGWVQNVSMFFGRAAHRYLKATNDRDFIDPLYANLKLMFQYWITTTGYQHPQWGTGVYLLTAPGAAEVTEASPNTPGDVTPKGDMMTTVVAYDYCVQMATIAQAIGQGQAEIDYWNLWADRFKTAVRTHCWNPDINWYVSVGVSGYGTDMTPFNIRTYHGWYALWAGIPTLSQAQSMRDIIMNSSNFKGAHGMRTLDMAMPGYNPNDWSNGGSRPHHDGVLATGLQRYSFTEDAAYVISRWTTIQKKYGTTPESLNPDTGVLGYAKFMTFGAGNLIEALLYKSSPSLLYGVGTSQPS